jgi:acyl dehydratase
MHLLTPRQHTTASRGEERFIMVLDQSLVGHETEPDRAVMTAGDIRAFADAIGDSNPIFRDEAAAKQAGFAHIPVPPTFITRLRVPFAEAGLDPMRSQILHTEQEYAYTRPLLSGDTVVGRHRIASIRQSGRGDLAIMTLEQFVDDIDGERIATGKATLLVRSNTSAGAAAGGGQPKARSTPAKSSEGLDDSTLKLVKHVTQEQIDAYADVSGDHNPIHINPEAARAVGLDGTIAHGMLNMAFVGQMLTDWLSQQLAGSGWVSRLRVRFQAMVRPNDTIDCYGRLTERRESLQALDVLIKNRQGEQVISGDADMTLA